MAMFVEVFDEAKGCEIIINLDEVMEVAPKIKLENGVRVDGGCDLFFRDSAAVGGKRALKVRDSYSLFKQFAMQTVSADDVAKRIESIQNFYNQPDETPQPKSTAKPAAKTTKKPVVESLEIPKL